MPGKNYGFNQKLLHQQVIPELEHLLSDSGEDDGMCGRMGTQTLSWREYYERLNFGVSQPTFNLNPNYDTAPTQDAPIVRLGEDGRIMSLARWGLVPFFWQKPLKEMKFSTFNARCETAASAASFREPWKKRRCLVVAEGYYEWNGPKGSKRRFCFRPTDGPLFTFAGLWDHVTIEGEAITSFTILTCTPNEHAAQYHTRMPVILDEDGRSRWLDPDLDDPAPLCAASANESIEVYEVARQGRGPELFEPRKSELF